MTSHPARSGLARNARDELDLFDVAIIGYGPVGQALTVMLASRGHRVVVIERWPTLFPLPRAGHVDHEVMRIFQSLGIAETLVEDSWPLSGYQWIDANGEVLRTFEVSHDAPSGWRASYSLFQPYLESLLHGMVSATQEVELLRGWRAEELALGDEEVTIVARLQPAAHGDGPQPQEVRNVRARYVVGCDGANSLVREACGIDRIDFGFEADWLVVFAEPSDRSVLINLPDVAQLLETSRPTTAFAYSGKRFCRFEFMLMPGETVDDMNRDEVAWKLIERWGLKPDNARLVRNTVFRFRSLVATDFRVGRAFIAGDAAHLMPPFLGQGMCAGLRDAKNLAWKLDLVLRDVADDRLLDSYTSDRRPHVESVVKSALRVGELISITDPERASERDQRLRDGTLTPPTMQVGPLVDGLLHRGADGVPRPPAGEMSIQARVELDGRAGLFDTVGGSGWAVLTTGWDAADRLSPEALRLLKLIEARIVRIESTPGFTGAAIDLEGRYLAWMAGIGAEAVIIRPDFYIFGAARDASELASCVEDLGRQLAIRHDESATSCR